MPGTTSTASAPTTTRTTETSSPDTTTPFAPADTASNASEAGDARPSPARLDSTVTATTAGAGRPAGAPSDAPRTAAATIASPPSACTVSMSMPSRAALRAACSTVVGMSCSLRSRNTGANARTRSTDAGPCAANSSSPTLRRPAVPSSVRASVSAASRSDTSSATTNGFSGRGITDVRTASRAVPVLASDPEPAAKVLGRGQSLGAEVLGDPLRDLDVCRGVDQQRRADLDRPRAGEEELDRVLPRGHAAHAEHRDVRHGPRDLVHGGERDRLDRRPGETTDRHRGLRSEPLGIDRERRHRVDQREPEGTRADASLRGLHDARDERGELGEHRNAGQPRDRADDLGQAFNPAVEGLPLPLVVEAREIDLEADDPFLEVEGAGHVDVLVQARARDRGDQRHPALAQAGKVVRQEGLHAGVLRAHGRQDPRGCLGGPG